MAQSCCTPTLNPLFLNGKVKEGAQEETELQHVDEQISSVHQKNRSVTSSILQVAHQTRIIGADTLCQLDKQTGTVFRVSFSFLRV